MKLTIPLIMATSLTSLSNASNTHRLPPRATTTTTTSTSIASISSVTPTLSPIPSPTAQTTIPFEIWIRVAELAFFLDHRGTPNDQVQAGLLWQMIDTQEAKEVCTSEDEGEDRVCIDGAGFVDHLMAKEDKARDEFLEMMLASSKEEVDVTEEICWEFEGRRVGC